MVCLSSTFCTSMDLVSVSRAERTRAVGLRAGLSRTLAALLMSAVYLSQHVHHVHAQTQQASLSATINNPTTGAHAEDTGVLLTPWWGMTLTLGETAVFDCGVYSAGDPTSVTLTWLDAKQTTMENNNRISLLRADKNNASDRSHSAFSVVTLTVTNVSEQDAGTYTCKVVRNDSSTATRNISLTLLTPEEGCSFEGGKLCGWTVGGASGAQWHQHRADDKFIIDRVKGARYDHTYGPSSHIGHFMDVDVQHSDSDLNGSAQLTSPTLHQHDSFRCLQFWYMFLGKKGGHLKVLLHSEDDTSEIFHTSDDSDKRWTLGQTTLAPQSHDYHVIFDAILCGKKCKQGVTAMDDVRIIPGKCVSASSDWPKNNLQVRLAGGSKPYQGRVEVLHDARWGTICSKQWGDKEGKVICRSLGYEHENADGIRNATFGPALSSYPIWLGLLRCQGTEDDIADCIKEGETWGDTNCAHGEDASVVCQERKIVTKPPNTPHSAKSPTLRPQATRPTNVSSTSVTTTTTTTTATTATTAAITGADKNKLPPAAVNPARGNAGVNVSSTTVPTPSATPGQPKTASAAAPSSTSTTTTTTTTTPTPTTTTTTTTTASTATTTTSTTSRPPASSTAKSLTFSPAQRPKVSHSGHGNVVPGRPPSVSLDNDAVKPESVTEPPNVNEISASSNNAGLAIGVVFILLVGASAMGIFLYRRKRKGKKSTYITFGNPSYSREHLPANDFSLESPLTLSSSGYTVLA